MKLVKSIFSRTLQMIFTLLGASLLIWSILPLAGGDPALRLLTTQGVTDPLPEQIQEVREELNLDEPLPRQYVKWLGGLFLGDLSTSYASGRPVLEEFGKRFPATLTLAGTALGLALLLTIPAALLSVTFHGRKVDQVIQVITQIGVSIPSFLIGLLILYIVVIQLGWGRILSDGDLHLVLFPASCLAINRFCDWTQLLRASLLEQQGYRYTMIPLTRGATKFRVLVRYVLPNALLPFLTAVGVGIGAMLGGVAIIEVVFTWPGIGSYVVQAITSRDFPVIQGFVTISTLIYVLMSYLVDLLAMLIDPRIQEGSLL